MRTRFAPSPTGMLHIGGLRTALYAYLVARQTNGKFLLRIEDTDQERSVPGAIENICNTLHWAGLDPDEGVMLKGGKIAQEGSCGPYMQSERLSLYRTHVDQLLAAGHAYPCFCTSERLDQMRADQTAAKQAPMYDRLCLSLPKEEVDRRVAAGEPHVIRMKIPREESIKFEDDIRGLVSFQGHTVDDQVLLKSDGFPTYHLAHVVDDHLMQIDIVIRGEEWLPSLPKHLVLFRMFGWGAPRYAHVPLLLNADRSKLSKRQGDVAAEDYKNAGYLPQALLNFVAMLGWNPGTEQEIFTMEELITQFHVDRVQKAGAVFDREKLNWLQGQWMRKFSPEDFANMIQPVVTETFPAAGSDHDFAQKAALVQDRVTFVSEAPGMLAFFYEAPKVDVELICSDKQKVDLATAKRVTEILLSSLLEVDEQDWNPEHLKELLFALASANELKNGQVLWPLRAILTGLPYSPGAFEVAVVLGKEETLKRLQKAKVELSK